MAGVGGEVTSDIGDPQDYFKVIFCNLDLVTITIQVISHSLPVLLPQPRERESLANGPGERKTVMRTAILPFCGECEIPPSGSSCWLPVLRLPSEQLGIELL